MQGPKQQQKAKNLTKNASSMGGGIKCPLVPARLRKSLQQLWEEKSLCCEIRFGSKKSVNNFNTADGMNDRKNEVVAVAS